MKKRIISLALALALMMGISGGAMAYTTDQYRAADALYHLGLFLGRSTTEKDFDLDGGLNRAEGLVLLIRMLGREEEAKAADSSHNPFEDVTGWHIPYIVYAYEEGIAKGRSDTVFDPKGEMSDNMFLTFALRALGYSDEKDADFNWRSPYALGEETGLIAKAEADGDFTRGDAVVVFWNALNAKVKDTGKKLSAGLIAEKIFTYTELKEAESIRELGYIPTPVVPSVPGVPSTPSAPVEPETPVEPEEGETERD